MDREKANPKNLFILLKTGKDWKWVIEKMMNYVTMLSFRLST